MSGCVEANIGFVILTAIYFYLLVKTILNGITLTQWNEGYKRKIKKRIVFALLTWIFLISVWSLSGMMSDFSKFPFNFMPIIIIPLITLIIITFSKKFKEILTNIPTQTLIRLQSFRFFVELLLWVLFIEQTIPVQMTFEGRNFDILAGITAPLIAWLSVSGRISRSGLITWNVLCLILLINIVTIAILSTPSPVRVFMHEPSSSIVTTFPVSWLPGLLVPLAYMLHFFSLRQLLMKR